MIVLGWELILMSNSDVLGVQGVILILKSTHQQKNKLTVFKMNIFKL